MATEDEVMQRAAEVIHYARKHEDGDPNEPCLVEMPSGRAWCGGPSDTDREIAEALAEAGLLNDGQGGAA